MSIGKINREIFPKLIALLLISAIVIYRTDRVLKTSIAGDGVEYVLMTESLRNHASPDLRIEDVQSFRKGVEKRGRRWENQQAKADFEEIEKFLNEPDKQFMRESKGFFVALNGKVYSYHFFFYSLLNVPFRAVADWTRDHPVSIYRKSNGFFIILACFIILFFSPIAIYPTIAVAIAFAYSPVFWYHDWTHPEALTMCLVASGLWLAFGKKYIAGLLFLSMACLQNQPLIALAGIYFLAAAIAYRNSLKKAAVSGVAFSMTLLPGIFYYLHFSTFNLVKEVGFLDPNLLTAKRIWSFYMDLNQGMILAIPLVLLVYPALWCHALIRTIRRQRTFLPDLFIPFIMLVIALGVCTMINWNHGQAVINRYASWSSTILLMSSLFLLSEGIHKKLVRFVFVAIILTQISTTIYHERTNMSDWGGKHKPIAEWMFKHFPGFYNPEPVIFITRTTHGWYSTEGMPVFYYDEDEKIHKMLVSREQVSQLTDYGADADKLKKLMPYLKYTDNWTYIYPPDIGICCLNQKIKNDINERLVQAVFRNIRSNPQWMEVVIQKAESENISLEQVMRKEAEPYLLFKNTP